jgi:hypothetical protein
MIDRLVVYARGLLFSYISSCPLKLEKLPYYSVKLINCFPGVLSLCVQLIVVMRAGWVRTAYPTFGRIPSLREWTGITSLPPQLHTYQR